MVEAVRAMTDPVAKALELERLKDEVASARKDISVLRTENMRVLRKHRDKGHPEGYSLQDIADLLKKPRASISYIVRGRGLAREAGDNGPDAQ
jgi:hypothetical protein